jgi:hypothetical protein
MQTLVKDAVKFLKFHCTEMWVRIRASELGIFAVKPCALQFPYCLYDSHYTNALRDNIIV